MLKSDMAPPTAAPPNNPRKALIFGVSGQDGAYLAQLLLAKGYAVWGTSRHAHGAHPNLHALGITARVKAVACDMLDRGQVRQLLDAADPDEIYNLAGQTSVSASFAHPVETVQSIAHASLNLLECIARRSAPCRLFHASSAECFGDAGLVPVTEHSPFHPKSPYGVAKSSAHWQVACYRDAFGLHASNGILFNHESPLRPRKFVTQKVIAAVGAIARGATEYVEAMWLMLQQPAPQDFIIATGQSHSLREFVDEAFAAIDRRSEDFLVQDGSLLRPTEIQYSYADPSKIERVLGWSATIKMADVVRLMLEADAHAHAHAHSTTATAN
jgi:GDPmannose 4,6-dehydratase